MPLLTNHEIATIYDRHFDRIYQFFLVKMRDQQIAEDLTSETFYLFVKNLKTKEDISLPDHFLYGIAKKVFLQYLKRKYHEKTIIKQFERLNGEELFLEKDAEIEKESLTPEERLKQYLDKIPQKQSEVLYYRLIDKMSMKEIAKKLGKNVNYVKVTQHRAIKNIRRIITCTP